MIDKILQKIDKFLNLDPSEVDKGKDLGKEITIHMRDVEKLISDDKRSDTYRKIISKIKNHSSKLSSDASTSKESSLSSDWKQLARQDLSKLKDEVLALQELITKHELFLRKRWNEKNYGLDIRDLVKRIKKEDSIDKVTQSKLANALEDMDDGEIGEITEKYRDRLSRISRWLVVLKEVDSVEG
ncbi:hypothetical protein AKJ52_00530 [candidate division MSBL1 archaeon SCGC-AAA382C18]|uniref:Uncharacterized protein n=1 Tax=candidate division MSBL1 archaeon SCGC-AAA382C18 TaxID=1698281 RepID=A0A133VLJ1_9EURY|nr:hypothetical protein AKJ52_00530 [candidate division MSBL1 archaeon SCGC-AAA382C18]